MALSVNPAGYIEPGVIENHIRVAAERGISLEDWAAQVAPESEHLAAVLRKRAAEERAAAAAESKASPSDAPKGRRSAPTDHA